MLYYMHYMPVIFFFLLFYKYYSLETLVYQLLFISNIWLELPFHWFAILPHLSFFLEENSVPNMTL